MLRLSFVLSLLCTFAFVAPALADAPPPNAKPLSEILHGLEQQDVAYFNEVEWDDDDGEWEIEYVTTGGQKREIKVDPVTGQIKD